MLVFKVGMIVVNDKMSVEDWFDELGKGGMGLTTSDEDAGVRCKETEDLGEDFG